ncbi:MAG: AAA family ATPase [Candidatus Dormibacteria bacterium]
MADPIESIEFEPPALPRKRSGAGRIITVVSGKAGAGKSTLVANLAAATARDRGLTTAVVDLALQFGDQALMFDAPPSPSMIDVLANVDALTVEFLVDCMHLSSGVRVLGGPPSPELADLVEVEHVRTILELARRAFDVVFLDTCSYLSDTTLDAIEEADSLVCLTTPYLASVKDTKLLLKTLNDLGIAGESLTVVLNRLEPGLKMASEVVEANIRFPVTFELPHAAGALLDAATDGVPLSVGNRGTDYAQKIAAIALALTADPGDQKGEKKRGLFGISR